ncbi:MAG: DUF3727 domain-containing protein [Leptolyngbyaceae bacterium]|nr:DUF3727 domain-containing protein [Leptolyngbyaceae bacterium]
MKKDLDNQVEGELPIVVLTEEDGRSLPCFVERSVDVDDVSYVLLLPVDTPVEILAWEPDEEDDDDEVLVDIDNDTVQTIFSTAKAVLAEHNLVLSNTALTLTVSGEIPEPEEEDVITLDIGDDSGDELSSEELQLIASFFHEEQEYAIYTPLDPLLFFARMGPDGQPNVLSPEEFERVRPYLENHLFDEVD